MPGPMTLQEAFNELTEIKDKAEAMETAAKIVKETACDAIFELIRDTTLDYVQLDLGIAETQNNLIAQKSTVVKTSLGLLKDGLPATG